MLTDSDKVFLREWVVETIMFNNTEDEQDATNIARELHDVLEEGMEEGCYELGIDYERCI